MQQEFWQVNPQLDNDQIVKLLKDTAYENDEELKFIDPVSFIEAVKKTVK